MRSNFLKTDAPKKWRKLTFSTSQQPCFQWTHLTRTWLSMFEMHRKGASLREQLTTMWTPCGRKNSLIFFQLKLKQRLWQRYYTRWCVVIAVMEDLINLFFWLFHARQFFLQEQETWFDRTTTMIILFNLFMRRNQAICVCLTSPN